MGSIIDIRGVSCPMNFVKAKFALELVEAGEKVDIMIDDGEPVRNVVRSLIAEGHRLLGISDGSGYCILSLEKAGD